MIASFGDKATEDIYNGVYSARVRRFPREILPAALNKLDMLNAAHNIDDLKAPPATDLNR